MSSLGLLIVEKNGTVRPLMVKAFSEEELFKKCGFKSATGFDSRVEWRLRRGDDVWSIRLYGKVKGVAGGENKYDFPPPMDTILFFGSCALVGLKNGEFATLTKDVWEWAYEKLFGGFEDLADTAEKDACERDALVDVPKHLKTRAGYLKDGFVVEDGSGETSAYPSADNLAEMDDSVQEPEEEEEVDTPLSSSELEEEPYQYVSGRWKVSIKNESK